MKERNPYIRGVGGYKCFCCGPARKDRDKYRRVRRKIEKRELEKEIKEVGNERTND